MLAVALPSAAKLLFALLAGHALCDYPLQGEYLALRKNHTLRRFALGKRPDPGPPAWQALWAHALIHGGMVLLLTGSLTLGLLEAVIHAATDRAKCAGRLTFDQDQGVHVACKALWAVVATLIRLP